MMPLVFTLITKLGDTGDVYELTVNSAEEEQRDERETEGAEGKEGKDDVEEYFFHNHVNFVYTGNGDIEYFARSKMFISINTDVLTPPPELI